MSKEKIPQNIKSLISEIGERMALFKVFELTHSNEDLEIFKNYSDNGYDIGIRNNKTGKKVKIEVKARQRLITTASDKTKNSCHFTLPENERHNADFLAGYWLEYHDFFIVPVTELAQSKSGDKIVYKYIVSRLINPSSVEYIYSDKSMPYLNNWELILKFIS
jgi:hypothetical protein